MTPAARTDLIALLDQVAAGTYRPLRGPHSYDADRAAQYRQAAVLALFTPAEGPDVDLFLVQRSPHLRHHPGQIALPGGRIEPTDGDPTAAAVRETEEETGIAAHQVQALGTLPPVLVPVSNFTVTPVLGWTEHIALTQISDDEVLHTLRVRVSDLVSPARRATVNLAGHRSYGFDVGTGWIWGFTGNLLDHLFTALGWALPWDHHREYAMSWDEARGAQLES